MITLIHDEKDPAYGRGSDGTNWVRVDRAVKTTCVCLLFGFALGLSLATVVM